MTPERETKEIKQSVSAQLGSHMEATLLNAALSSPEVLDEFSDLPQPSDFIVGWAPIAWDCVLEARKGGFSMVRFTEQLKERGLAVEEVNDILNRAHRAYLAHDEIGQAVQFLKDRRLVIRSQVCAQEYLQTLEREPYSKVAGLLERLQRQLADVAAGSGQVETWAFGDQVSSAKSACVATGITDLDALTGGLEQSVLGIIGARPSQGKSALECSTVLNLAARGEGSGIFSLEMPSYHLQCRMAAAWTYQPGELWGGNSGNPYYEPFLKGKTPPGSPHHNRMTAALEEVRQLPIAFDQHKGLTVTDIRARTRRLKAMMEHKGHPLKAVFIDHIGHITPEKNRGGNRTSETTDISKGLMDMAGELEVAVVALAQLNRAVEQRAEKRPMLADLRESGSLEQDAAWVAFLYRDEYYADREAEDPDAKPRRVERNTLEVIVSKQRNGPIGTAKLFCEMGANAILDRPSRAHVRAA